MTAVFVVVFALALAAGLALFVKASGAPASPSSVSDTGGE